MKFIVFRFEFIGVVFSQWVKFVRMKYSYSQDYSYECVVFYEYYYIGILGFIKDYNDYGNLVNIILGMRLYYGCGYVDYYEGYKYSKEVVCYYYFYYYVYLYK